MATFGGGSQSFQDTERRTESGRKFWVYVSGNTNNSHEEWIKKLKGIGHHEVSSPENSDYLLVFCPIVSRPGVDIREALERVPGGKPIILVVMHHTINPGLIISESRRQVENPDVKVTVDCLFYEDKLLKCPRNEDAWTIICEALESSRGDWWKGMRRFVEWRPKWPQLTLGPLWERAPGAVASPASAATVSGRKFCVYVSGNTNNSHEEWIRKLKGFGHREVPFPENSDYLLVFCPIVSRVGTDIGEALERVPGGKPIILVVMHHTFNPGLIISESRRQVENPDVKVTVDCLFHEDKLLKCPRNEDAWTIICNTLEFSQVGVCNGVWNWLWNTFISAVSAVIWIMRRTANIIRAVFFRERRP